MERFRADCGMQTGFTLALEHRNSQATFEHRMLQPTGLAGSDPRSSILLPSSIAGRKEFLFQVLDGRLYCLGLGEMERHARVRRKPLDASGIELHGFSIRAYESSGAEAELEHKLRIASLDGGGEDETGGEFELAMLNDRRRDVVVPLDRKVTVMGRSSRCRVVFNSAAASRFHATCVATRHGVWVVDLTSRTGTFVNEAPIRIRRLDPGDTVRIGTSRFEFRLVRDPWEGPADDGSSDVALRDRLQPIAVSDRSPVDEEPSRPTSADVISLVAQAMNESAARREAPLEAREIARILNELLLVQSLQLEEIRRLYSVLSGTAAASGGDRRELLPASSAAPNPPPPRPAPLKATGAGVEAPAEPDVHEWFQEHNDSSGHQSRVTEFLRRVIGQG